MIIQTIKKVYSTHLTAFHTMETVSFEFLLLFVTQLFSREGLWWQTYCFIFNYEKLLTLAYRQRLAVDLF